jgi:hypothetical protein
VTQNHRGLASFAACAGGSLSAILRSILYRGSAMTSTTWTRGVAAIAICALAPLDAAAFGPEGHRIAGLLAARRLCPVARAEVTALAGDTSLAELGVWADTIRGRPEWRASGPWHYMNVADPRDGSQRSAATAIRAFRDPPEGDVLSAIERFRGVLADRSQSRERRLDALRFVIHLVADVHQPLHVGRASDRGGNSIDVRYGDTVVNLHRFWDSDVIELRKQSPQRYARRLTARFYENDVIAASFAPVDPRVWAAESLALRPVVYAFPAGDHAAPAVLDAAYLAAAEQVTDERLVLAAARIAATLNAVWCTGP